MGQQVHARIRGGSTVVIYIPTEKYKYMVIIESDTIFVMPRSRGYGDATATYIRRLEIPSRIYAKH